MHHGTIALRRRVALLTGTLFTLLALVLTGSPANAAVHYPWQDPGAARPFTEAAVTQVGLSYCWGGGNANGPTAGLSSSGCAANGLVGFDCSGLVHFALAQAGRDPGDNTANGYARNLGRTVSSPAPGDLLFWDWDRNGVYDHVGIFLGVNRDNNVTEFVEASGWQGVNATTGHRVKISAYGGAHLIKRVY